MRLILLPTRHAEITVILLPLSLLSFFFKLIQRIDKLIVLLAPIVEVSIKGVVGLVIVNAQLCHIVQRLMLSPVYELTLTHHHVFLQRAGRPAFQLRSLDRGPLNRDTQLLFFIIISWNRILSRWNDSRCIFVCFLL